MSTLYGRTLGEIQELERRSGVLKHLENTPTYKLTLAQMELEKAEADRDAASQRIHTAKEDIKLAEVIVRSKI